MKAYQAWIGGESRVLFKTRKEAKAYIEEQIELHRERGDFDIDWEIERVTLVKPTLDNMIAIINSFGGQWCVDSVPVEEGRVVGEVD